ncbi:MAG: purine-binding chemotaxis protein CheW [Deltaproteobacteria bacterium]|nr:purine-binding chemotaxis protein CheW [Deltaproteobacteria bacterium]
MENRTELVQDEVSQAVAAIKDKAGLSVDTAQVGKYLTFKIADETYGVEILKVQEIIQLLDITRVPKMPGFVRGVINLRGKVIPVMSLRKKFGIEDIPDTDRTCIIVINVPSSEGVITMGLVVDSVSEVLDIGADAIQESPSFGVSVDTTFILGMGKVDKKVVILLDIDRILSSQEAETIVKGV